MAGRKSTLSREGILPQSMKGMFNEERRKKQQGRGGGSADKFAGKVNPGQGGSTTFP